MSKSGLQRKSRLMSAAERNFYQLLSSSLGSEYAVFAKVRVLDVVETGPNVTWMKAKKIEKTLAENFLDFVICRLPDMSIYGVIELEKFDNKEGKKSGKKRETLVADVCEEAKLKVFAHFLKRLQKLLETPLRISAQIRLQLSLGLLLMVARSANFQGLEAALSAIMKWSPRLPLRVRILEKSF